jgi:D-glycero-D-manno-heptose 1,7-bisphosphate phosphatase
LSESGTEQIAVFLDRDGTIIEDTDYLSDPDGIQLIPGAAEAIVRLNQRGIRAILVTNQSGVARGYFTVGTVEAIHRRLAELLAGENAILDSIYFCPHLPHDILPVGQPPCDCRKPETGMAIRARSDHGIDLEKSFFIGDRLTDIELAERVGGTGILVRTGYGRKTLEEIDTERPDFHVCDDLSSAIDLVFLLISRH